MKPYDGLSPELIVQVAMTTSADGLDEKLVELADEATDTPWKAARALKAVVNSNYPPVMGGREEKFIELIFQTMAAKMKEQGEQDGQTST